jgi:hypothetical protein
MYDVYTVNYSRLHCGPATEYNETRRGCSDDERVMPIIRISVSSLKLFIIPDPSNIEQCHQILNGKSAQLATLSFAIGAFSQSRFPVE